MWGTFGRAHDVEGVRALLAEGRRAMQGQGRKLSPGTAKRAAAIWNEAYPVGTPVRYWPGAKEGPGVLSKTRSEAWATDFSVPVVLVEGRTDYVALTHVEAVDEGEGPTP